MTKKVIILLLGTILSTLISCGPKTLYKQVYPKLLPPKESDAYIEIAEDPPGKPYLILGVASAAGFEDDGPLITTGNSKSEVFQALLQEARKQGGDAIHMYHSASSSRYSIGSIDYRLHKNTTHMTTAYVLRWAREGDSLVLPGNVKISEVLERANQIEAKNKGINLTPHTLSQIKVGETTKEQVQSLLGEPYSENIMQTFGTIETWAYDLVLYDPILGIKKVIYVVQFRADGKVMSINETRKN